MDSFQKHELCEITLSLNETHSFTIHSERHPTIRRYSPVLSMETWQHQYFVALHTYCIQSNPIQASPTTFPFSFPLPFKLHLPSQYQYMWYIHRQSHRFSLIFRSVGPDRRGSVWSDADSDDIGITCVQHILHKSRLAFFSRTSRCHSAWGSTSLLYILRLVHEVYFVMDLACRMIGRGLLVVLRSIIYCMVISWRNSHYVPRFYVSNDFVSHYSIHSKSSKT